MKFYGALLILLTGFVVSGPAEAQGLDRQKEALATIRDFANSLCTTPPIEEIKQHVELSGSAKAKLAGLLNKVADIGIDGAAKYSNDSSKGVLQSELAQAIKNGNDCRLSVFNKLIDKLLPIPGSSSMPVASPEGEAPKMPVRFNKPDGYFLREGNAWIEYPPYAPNQYFLFRDFGVDKNYAYLIDRSRTKTGGGTNAMIVRLPLRGGIAQWSYQNPLEWTDFTIVTPE